MTLTVPEIVKRLRDGSRNRARLSEAIRHEQRLCFHAETALARSQASPALNDFLAWVKGILPADKYRAFMHLMRFPISTVELTEQIFAALEKVFEGRNPVFKYEFTSPEAEGNWDDYREAAHHAEQWREKAFQAMQHAISSILVVDLPGEQEGSRPEPYWYLLPIYKVIDYELEKDGSQFAFIAFDAGDEIAVFDAGYYRVFAKDQDGTIGQLLRESAHDLEYCPARFFWSKSISTKYPEVKESPITKQLGDLDQYLFKCVSTTHLDTYAPYPIFWGFATDCDYEYGEGEHSVHCRDGFLVGYDDTYILADGKLKECPRCAVNQLSGAGSYVEIEPPGPDNDNANLREPVGALWPQRDILDYNNERVAALADRIYRNVTGYGGEPNNDQAVNEKQVMAAFEGRADVLRNLKINFEKAQKWVDSTICRLRYGSQFVSASIDYGTEFYLYSAESLLMWYHAAREGGSDDAILDSLYDQYLQTKHKNNPGLYYRARVLFDLDPLRHTTKADAGQLYATGIVSFEDYYLKVNFSTLIGRFERDNIPVQLFGEILEYPRKIEAIREGLNAYIQQPQVAQTA
jgi:hypothetical protein